MVRYLRRAGLRQISALGMAVVFVAGWGAQAASAVGPTTNRQTDLRDCGDTRCGPIATLPVNAALTVYCWRDAGSYLGTTRWFRVAYQGKPGFVSANAVNGQPVVPYCSTMESGDRLYGGQSVWSPNGKYQLLMQTDGNLVEYGPSGAIWSAMTTGTNSAWFTQQGDGNGVVYGSGGSVWANGTNNSGARLQVQDDANIVTYTGATAVYATNQHRWDSERLRAVGATNPGDAGQCTAWAMDQARIYMKRNKYPDFYGNARDYDNAAPGAGFTVQTMPTSHAIVVIEPGTYTSSGGTYHATGSFGHVAWADSVQVRGDGTYVHITEMNANNVPYSVSNTWIRHTSGVSYIPMPSL